MESNAPQERNRKHGILAQGGTRAQMTRDTACEVLRGFLKVLINVCKLCGIWYAPLRAVTVAFAPALAYGVAFAYNPALLQEALQDLTGRPIETSGCTLGFLLIGQLLAIMVHTQYAVLINETTFYEELSTLADIGALGYVILMDLYGVILLCVPGGQNTSGNWYVMTATLIAIGSRSIVDARARL